MLATCFFLTGQPCILPNLARTDTFELHLTTVPLAPERLREYRQVCAQLKVKAIVIELAPDLPVQPMTCQRVEGGYQEALKVAGLLREQLLEHGFPTRRLKIEAAPWNAGVPLTDDVASEEPAGRYFEFHARILVAENRDLTALNVVCVRHRAHLSRNPLKIRDDGQQERFVTLRYSGVGRETTEARAGALLDDLTAAGWSVAATILEYCVYDDHLELDGGWGAA